MRAKKKDAFNVLLTLRALSELPVPDDGQGETIAKASFVVAEAKSILHQPK